MKRLLAVCTAVAIAAAPGAPRASGPDSTATPASAFGARDSTRASGAHAPAPGRSPHQGLDLARPAGRAPHDTIPAEELMKLRLPPSPPRPRGRPPRVTAVALDIRHRMFANFRELEVVRMREAFRVGDTEFTARLIEFVPDWSMGLKDFKVYNRSNEPNNPAFHIEVREKGVVRDTVWALMNMPPHFAPRSLLAFKVLRIEFADHSPVPAGAPDSLAARRARMPDSSAAGSGRP